MKYFTTLTILLLLTTSCYRQTFTVQSEYVARGSLASVKIDTPDPRKENRGIGQRLRMTWALPPKTFTPKYSHIIVDLFLKNGEAKQKKFILTEPSGMVFFYITGDDYRKKGGLLNYRVQLWHNDVLYREIHHKFWSQPIKIDDTLFKQDPGTIKKDSSFESQ